MAHELNLEGLFHEKRIEYRDLKTITNNFSDDWVVGTGGFGVVYKGKLRDGGFIAVKKFMISSVYNDEDFRNEVDCLTRIKHRNIVRYLGYCAEAHKERGLMYDKEIWADVLHRFICLEYVHNGSLDKYLTAGPRLLEWHVCYKIIKGVCLGLKYLHEQNIIHRDIKPGNILLDNDMSPKIADFGLSRFLDDGQSRIVTSDSGTWLYMAPETKFQESRRVEFTLKSDIFSLGVVISEIMRGRSRMTTEKDTVLEWSGRLNQLDASKKQTALEQVKACIDISLKCKKEAANRPSIQDIVDWLHWSVASDINTSLASPLAVNAKQASKQSEVLPGPSSSTPARGLGDKVLSAKALQITWGEIPEYWSWNSRHNSRFGECAELLKVYFLAVTGKIPPRDLSAGASYEVYLVYKLAPGATGLRGGAVLTSSLRLYGERIVATGKVSLDPEAQRVHGVIYPVARSNGWLEIKLAEFATDGGMLGEKAVIVDLREENDTIKKSGLIIECMEFRSRTL